jgi:DNA polymerase-1
MSTTLLVDGDALAYRVAAATERETEWAPGEITLSTSLSAAKEGIELHLRRWREHLNAGAVKMALSDTPWTFRMDVYKPYKAHRKDVRKPLGLKALRQYLMDEHNGVILPGLEADDLMGLWMTDPKKHQSDGVIVSWDKDMRAVPGRFWVPGTEEVEERDEMAANIMWMAQALSGDAADGYPGCKNIGVVRAKRIIEAAVEDASEANLEVMWDAVKAEYLKKSQSYEDALVNARLARILRHGDYDLKEKKVRLWMPPDLTSSRSTVMLRVRGRAPRRASSNTSHGKKALGWTCSPSRSRSVVRVAKSSRRTGAKRRSAST